MRIGVANLAEKAVRIRCLAPRPMKKGNKIVRWYYSLKDDIVIKPGEKSHYMKGLGSFKASDLEYIISKDGLSKMLVHLEFDVNCEQAIEDWLGDDSTPRKKHIMGNDFSIAKL